MPDLSLTLPQARLLAIAAQGLHQPPSSPATPASVLESIRRMGVLQIDTIHVVARSPYLVLWSRLGSYEPGWLDDLLAGGAVFEGWSHAACFIPIEDYPLYRWRMLHGIKGWWDPWVWVKSNPEMAAAILERIHQEGPLRSADFESPNGRPRSGGWWNWKEEKQALEHLFTAGELMVARRHNFQRVYDLRQRVLSRVLPSWDDAALPDAGAVLNAHILRTVEIFGLARPRWIPDYFRLAKTETYATAKTLAEQGQLIPVAVEGWSESAYLHPANLPLLQSIQAGEILPSYTTLLSPFDPLVWDRQRARDLFGFDFAIECYLPEAKRRFGYFSLPILSRGRLVGRLDPKAHRQDKVFEVKSIHLETDVLPTPDLVHDLAGALQRCADWHKTPQVVIRQANPSELAPLLEDALHGG